MTAPTGADDDDDANGLRKLIRRAKKDFTKTSTLNRRLNKFGRLRAEELEERIAP